MNNRANPPVIPNAPYRAGQRERAVVLTLGQIRTVPGAANDNPVPMRVRVAQVMALLVTFALAAAVIALARQ